MTRAEIDDLAREVREAVKRGRFDLAEEKATALHDALEAERTGTSAGRA